MNERITIDPAICHGKPVISGTRVLVANLLADLATGSTIDELLRDYPGIDREAVLAALQFSSELAQFESLPADFAS